MDSTMKKKCRIFYALILVPIALVLSGCASGRRTATVHDADTRSGINGTETDQQIDDSDQPLLSEVRGAESGTRKVPVPPEQISIAEQADVSAPDIDIEPAPAESHALATADPEISKAESLDVSVPDFYIEPPPVFPHEVATADPEIIEEPADLAVADIDIEPPPVFPHEVATADPEMIEEPADLAVADIDVEPPPVFPHEVATADPEMIEEPADLAVADIDVEPPPVFPHEVATADPEMIEEPADLAVADIYVEPPPVFPHEVATVDPEMIEEPADVAVADIYVEPPPVFPHEVATADPEMIEEPADVAVADIDVEPVPEEPHAPATADPNIRKSPPASALTVQPEAVLRIRVKEDPTLDGQYAVNRIGAVNLGYIGPIILFNYTEQQAAEKIREVLITRAFRNATVEVEILRASYDRIGIGGLVNNAGLLRIGAGDVISLNDALLRAGGLSGPASGMQVRIVRGGLTNVLASAQEGEVYAMQGADGRPAVPRVWLRNNDKAIVFSTRPQGAAAEYGDKEVIVLGEVSRPGPIRFAHGEPATMMRLAFKIGGFPRYANTRQVRILRRDEQGIEREIKVNVERMLETGDPEKDVPLQDGDRIIVPARRISLF